MKVVEVMSVIKVLPAHESAFLRNLMAAHDRHYECCRKHSMDTFGYYYESGLLLKVRLERCTGYFQLLTSFALNSYKFLITYSLGCECSTVARAQRHKDLQK